jgi:hypothetical protein
MVTLARRLMVADAAPSGDVAGAYFDGVDDVLSRDFGAGTLSDAKKWTLAFWGKPESGYITIQMAGGAGSYFQAGFGAAYIEFDVGTEEPFSHYWGDGYTDPTPTTFYMFTFDSTNATAANRLRLWAGPYGGVIQEIAYTQPSPTVTLNDTMPLNGLHNVQGRPSVFYTEGTVAAICFLDGISSTDPADFVNDPASNATPKVYAGSFGNLGYYLDFANSGDLGNDVSGNNNDFTVGGAPSQVTPFS